MNKNTRKALIKRECQQYKDLLKQFAEELVIQAKNEVRAEFLQGSYMENIKTILGDFNTRNSQERSTLEYIQDVIDTHEVFLDYFDSMQDKVNSIPMTIHMAYEKFFHNSMEEFDCSVEIVVQRLHGIATPKQLEKEFIATSEQVDSYIVDEVIKYSEELVFDINLKVNELLGGFCYEVDNVVDYITTHMIYEEEEVTVVKYKKITDRKELEQLARNNGFELKRQHGSHKVYENADGKVTVIAQHNYDIGKGISHKIQKQILNN